MTRTAQQGRQQRDQRCAAVPLPLSLERLISAPTALGVMLSGRKWGGKGGLPHLGFDGHGEAMTSSRDDKLLRCSPILGVDSAQAILWLQ
jgi:hypothetical protein